MSLPIPRSVCSLKLISMQTCKNVELARTCCSYNAPMLASNTSPFQGSAVVCVKCSSSPVNNTGEIGKACCDMAAVHQVLVPPVRLPVTLYTCMRKLKYAECGRNLHHESADCVSIQYGPQESRLGAPVAMVMVARK